MRLDFSSRSTGTEIMDDLHCSGEVVEQTLEELEVINKWLGGNTITLKGIKTLMTSRKNLDKTTLTIADLGCGSGGMLRLVTKEMSKQGFLITATGIDANPNIVQYAEAKSRSFKEIRFETINVLSDEFRNQHFDIILGTLFFHHFTSQQLIVFFKRLKTQARLGIVINDLHRHWFAYYSIKVLTLLFSKSEMVKNDAPLSVLRGFRKSELLEIMNQAGIVNYTLYWKWAFRWKLVIHSNP
jgi:2-polyprenyl-3-methyl-5-hydroxy-6-metoxy-1,4-benzoquinol methylase